MGANSQNAKEDLAIAEKLLKQINRENLTIQKDAEKYES